MGKRGKEGERERGKEFLSTFAIFSFAFLFLVIFYWLGVGGDKESKGVGYIFGYLQCLVGQKLFYFRRERGDGDRRKRGEGIQLQKSIMCDLNYFVMISLNH